MREGSSSNVCGLQDSSMVVQLPYSSQQLSSLLTILYEHSIEVRASHDVGVVGCLSRSQECLNALQDSSCMPQITSLLLEDHK
jgi:hypothetical protein